jgi:hypothetical protein
MVFFSKGIGLEMLMTWSKYASILKIGVVLVEDCIITIVVSTKEELKCWETKYESEPEGLSNKDYASSTIRIAGHK